MTQCILCGAEGEPADEEHVIPKWARRAFDIQGRVTLSAKDNHEAAFEQVASMRRLNIVLKDAICRRCNNEWLSNLENRVSRFLKPMAIQAKPTVLDAAAQKLLALWAAKTAFLLELAIRQQFTRHRRIGGYQATPQELTWLRCKNEPPPRSMAWLGAWDCEQKVPVNYEPSGAELPTADGTPLAGHLTTFTLGYTAFQVFTVDYIAADLHGAPVWNPTPPAPLKDALPRIWPPQLTTPDINWPPPAFTRDGWHRLVTWGGVLRPGKTVQTSGPVEGMSS